jgi:type I restriction enzyme M protein
MLDAETKRRIDAARDILVGKVPDPKSQVEQITIALIYKFMDDMDAQAEELGGQRTFFAGEFAKYGWPQLTRAGRGGFETLNLYAEAIARMPENQGIPQLFRTVFSNAFLPYRDPETLRLFLKTIDEFSYDDSESLGDAYEYLLSVLGSQGDTGQFRTPRHIIDFIVSVIDPRKEETILDPACGTAGFLISAYRHIREANADANGTSVLTPDERTRLARNFRGYDIDPGMVHLSLVNLYLHGFVAPQIAEYDTLTGEERWTEYADVVIANPPFMSPKGGIRPHDRFSIKSRRSEVLFVDYMAEHLTPHGRAGIIVPEGIIFQSQNAHRQLRKMLVENYLVAVVSLPAGVFQPYSGVKTSVLILDRALARRGEKVAFFKVENDGFDLGAQRRPIDRNDLPQVQGELAEYLRRRREGQPLDDFQPAHGLVVEKDKIAADGEYNLSGERYRENQAIPSSWPMVALGEVAEVVAGQSPPGESYNDTGAGTPFYQGKTEFGEMFLGTPVKWTTAPRRLADKGDLLMSVRAPVGPVNMATQKVCIGRGLAAIKPKAESLIDLYAFYILHSIESKITGSVGAAFSSITRGEIEQIQIPLPPLSVQQEIVAEIEGYQKVIEAAKATIEASEGKIRTAIGRVWEG